MIEIDRDVLLQAVSYSGGWATLLRQHPAAEVLQALREEYGRLLDEATAELGRVAPADYQRRVLDNRNARGRIEHRMAQAKAAMTADLRNAAAVIRGTRMGDSLAAVEHRRHTAARVVAERMAAGGATMQEIVASTDARPVQVEVWTEGQVHREVATWRARPRRDPEQKARCLQLLADGHPVIDVCRAERLPYGTVYVWATGSGLKIVKARQGRAPRAVAA